MSWLPAQGRLFPFLSFFSLPPSRSSALFHHLPGLHLPVRITPELNFPFAHVLAVWIVEQLLRLGLEAVEDLQNRL